MDQDLVLDMGLKLGTERGNYAVSGEIRTKLRFHQESGGDASVPGTPVIRKDLEPDVLAEANMDGSIYLSNEVIPGSFQERLVLAHEMRHATDMKIGKTEYTDDYVKHNGNTYPRETIDGKDMILIDGRWKEAGDEGFPWEDGANHGMI